MATTRDELHQLLDALPEGNWGEVHDFLRLMLEDQEELTPEELQEIRRGEEEFRRGEWVRWETAVGTDA